MEDKNTYQFGIRGYPANEAAQPVVRGSWEEAMAFCRWIAARTGLRFTLPTEAQWEWACRAGASTPFSFAARDADFSGHANFADAKLREFAIDPDIPPQPRAKGPKSVRIEEAIGKEWSTNLCCSCNKRWVSPCSEVSGRAFFGGGG